MIMKMKKSFAFLFSVLFVLLVFESCDKPVTPKAIPPAKPCPDVAEVEYEGEVYPTVQIGTQCWLAKNLNVGKQIGHIYNSTDNDTIEKYCYFNQEKYCDRYGGLYKWDEVMQYATEERSRGICPEGWHVPTSDEFMELYFYVDGCPIYLMSNSPEFGYSNNKNCFDCLGITGFELLMGGRAYLDGDGKPFKNLNISAYMWTSSQAFTFFWGNEFSVFSLEVPTSRAYSVRCIKDQ
jgi:uncharacterized protein (TIGR02145 family)